MKQYPFILLVFLFTVTACQCDKPTDKSAEVTAPATPETTAKLKVTNSDVTPAAKVMPTMVAATSSEEKQVASNEDKEVSGVDLHKEHCVRCHGADYYPKADSKMDSYKRLHTMVGMCDAQLETGLFPEELQSITDYLNDSFYKFKK
jgi:cytochrome c5